MWMFNMCAGCQPASIHASWETRTKKKRSDKTDSWLNNATFHAAAFDFCPSLSFGFSPFAPFASSSFVLQRLDDKDTEEERKCPLFPGQKTIVSAEPTWATPRRAGVRRSHRDNNTLPDSVRRDQSESQGCRFSLSVVLQEVWARSVLTRTNTGRH